MTEKPQTSRNRLRWTDLFRLLVPAASVIAGIVWVLGSVSLSAFYGEFGVEPSEAGWNPATLLTRSGLGLFIAIAYSLGLFVALLGGLLRARRFLNRKWVQNRRSADPGGASLEKPPGDSTLSLAIIGLLVVTLIVGLFSLDEDSSAIVDTKSGSAHPAGIFAFPSIGTTCVRFIGNSGSLAASIHRVFEDTETEFLLLGQSGGIAIAYHPTTEATIRIPTSQLIVESGPRVTCEGEDPIDRLIPGGTLLFLTVALWGGAALVWLRPPRLQFPKADSVHGEESSAHRDPH